MRTPRAGRLQFAPAKTAFLVFALAVLMLSRPVMAADDSNAGELTQVPTVSAQQLNSALSTLSQGNTDPQLQQLISQFQAEMSSGNYSAAASTLVKLQGLSANPDSGSSQSLSALLQSLSVGSNGATVNASTLQSLLNAFAQSQAGATPQSKETLSLDMQSLADLMQYANSTMASELLQNSAVLGQSAFVGSSGGAAPSAPVSLPGVSGMPGIGIPSVGAPSLSVGTPSARVPAIPLADFLVPIFIALAVGVLFVFRGRVAGMVGTQSLPGMPLFRGGKEAGPEPSDPRKRIEYYFGRAVRLMARRGVPKLECETHREFVAKCDDRPEKPQVSTISSLYEKAKFSGEDVAGTDAYLAATSYLAMENQGR